MRPTWYEIDLRKVRRNVELLRSLAGDSLFCAVVKADAYGHGSVPIARTAVEAGAQWLAVALIEEAVELRAGGLEVPILLLSEPRPDEMVEVAAVTGLRPTLYTPLGIDACAASAPGLSVHLKVDTGMHRVGTETADATSLVRRALDAGLVLEGIYTHFAVADKPYDPFTEQQIRRFDLVLEELASAGVEPEIVHLSNTAGLLTRPDLSRSMVRVGVGVYGVSPSPELSPVCEDFGLTPIGHLRSEVTRTHVVPAGESVSYGRQWLADRPTFIATVPVGYGDGIPRGWWKKGDVLVRGQRRPIRGVITMDHLMVEVDIDVDIGDEVVLIGFQGSETLTAEEIAIATDTISYEILTSIGNRVSRRHRSNV